MHQCIIITYKLYLKNTNRDKYRTLLMHLFYQFSFLHKRQVYNNIAIIILKKIYYSHFLVIDMNLFLKLFCKLFLSLIIPNLMSIITHKVFSYR